MSETPQRRPCCATCVFLHREIVGIVDWEYNEQVGWNFCVLRDLEMAGEELRVIGDGERNAGGICAWYERSVIE